MTRFIGRNVLSLGLAAALGTLATSQKPVVETTPTPGDLSIAERAFGIAVDGDTIRALGPAYKAFFSDAGMEFTPALGKRAPRSYPLRFQLQSIRRGGHTIYDTVVARSPGPRLDGNTVLYGRGPGLVERYEVRADGIEQSIVFDERPVGFGELVVRGRIDTELENPTPGETNDGMTFLAEGLGGVRIGAVLGIDALGWSVPGTLRFDGTQVELVLPGELVENAVYPLVLDPLISAELTVMSSSNQDRDPDVAFDESLDRYLVVWERAFSSLDVDILGQMLDPAGMPVGGLIPILANSRLTINPTVANVDLGNSFFVAYQDALSPFGPWNIRGVVVTAAGAVSATIPIATSSSINETNPDAGGMSTAADDKVVVVWEQDGSIPGLRARSVDLGTLAVGTIVTVTSNANDHEPAISKSAGAGNRHLVVWERHLANGVNLVAASTDHTGSVLQTNFPVVNPVLVDVTHPAVDGDGTRFLVAYERQESAGSASHGIYCRMLALDASGTISTAVPGTLIEDVPSDDQIQPAVAYLGVKYLVAWADQESNISHDVYARALNMDGQPCGPRWQVSFGSPLNLAPAIASRYSGRSNSGFGGSSSFDQAMMVYHSGSGNPPFDAQIRGRLFEAIGSGGPVTNLGPGCGTGGTIAANGPVALGNSEFGFTLSGADPGTVLYGIGLGLPGSTLSCGPCSFLNASYVFYPPSGAPGTAQHASPIPCVAALAGLAIDAQWIAFGTASSPCPLAATLSASNRIRVTLGL